MNGVARVHWDELDDWATILARLEDWLLHAAAETVADYQRFKHWPHTFDDFVATIGALSVRVRDYAAEAQR